MDIPVYSTDPNLAWSKEQVKQRVDVLKPQSYDVEKPSNHTRFVCISDTHNRVGVVDIPPGDVLLHAGDFTRRGTPEEVKKFLEVLNDQPHQHKVVIAGNHDMTFDTENYLDLCKRFSLSQEVDCEEVRSMLIDAPGVTYLQDSLTTINGITIWGSPWQPEFCDMAFNLPRGAPCLGKWDLIPSGVDILMTHGPPLGHGDLCMHGGRAGCLQLLHTIQKRVKPKYHIFGHIHEGYGITSDGITVYINASTCNRNNHPLNTPIIFDLPNGSSA